MTPDEILRDMEERWKEGGEFTDVEATFWHPEAGPDRVEQCPKCGSRLHRWGHSPHGWMRVPDRLMYRQTRSCPQDGFARIYVVSATVLEATKWSLENDNPD